MYKVQLKNKTILTILILIIFALIAGPITLSEPSVYAEDNRVDFHLKLIEEEATSIEVTLEFKVEKGQKVTLMPESDVPGLLRDSTLYIHPTMSVSPAFSIISISEETIALNGLTETNEGWLLTGLKNGTARVVYRWQLLSGTTGNTPYTGIVNGDEDNSVLPVLKHDLKILDAEKVLICPKNSRGMEYICEDYRISVEKRNDEKLLVPWELRDDGKSFDVQGTETLLENSISWGILDEVTVRKEKPEIIAGFSTDFQSLSDNDKTKCAKNLDLLYTDLKEALGPNAGVKRLTIIMSGKKRFSLDGPRWDTFKSSAILFNEDKDLKGKPSVYAAGALFDLWNRYEFVPASSGDALWFMEGMSRYYPLKTANNAGLLDKDKAYELFSELYADYISDPTINSVTLQKAEIENRSGLPYAGAVLCSAIDKRLIDETGGEKDISWLAGEMSKKFKHSKDRDYGLSDIVKILDSGTKGGWRKFLDERVIEKHLILASEFSNSKSFGSGSLRSPSRGSSKRNWILLAIAIVVILSLPVVFSTYVRRAVKLDIQMPKILPDDWDDDEESDEDKGKIE